MPAPSLAAHTRYQIPDTSVRANPTCTSTSIFYFNPVPGVKRLRTEEDENSRKCARIFRLDAENMATETVTFKNGYLEEEARKRIVI